MDVLTRPASRADVASILALYWLYDEAIRGARDTDETDITGDWDAPGFDLSTSTLIVEEEGSVIGYAVVDAHGSADTVTSPVARAGDVQDRVLAWLEARGIPLEHHLPAADTEVAERLRRRGWTPTRQFWRMRIELDAPTPQPRWPAEVEVRSFERGADDSTVHELIETCFAQIGGQRPRTLEQWSAFLLDTPRFDASMCVVAWRKGKPVGAVMSEDVDDYGFVRQLAVSPDFRGKGLGIALLYECFRRHAERGLPATVLFVDAANPTGAIALYEKAGMRVAEQFLRWEWAPAPD